MNDHLVDQLGGRVRLVQIVTDFYRRVLESQVLADFFRDASMETLIVHQAEFIGAILETSTAYSDQELAAAHAHLVISDYEFDELLRLMRATLEDYSVKEQDVEGVVDAFVQRRPFIVNSN